jgi:DNA-binding CsgD family transcriptional regulator
MRTPDAPSDLLLTLYRGARERPIEAFQEFALQLIKPLLQFDSAVWGTGTLLEPGVSVHLAHLHELPPEHMKEWATLCPHERVIPVVVADPGRPKQFHLSTLFADRDGAAMLDFTKRARWQMAMVTAFLDPGYKTAQWVSLYRPNPDHHYSDQEQSVAQFLLPHLVESLTINRAVHSQSVYGDGAVHNAHLAVCDRKGLLHYAQPEFVSALVYEWPAWDGERLPAVLLDAIVLNWKSYLGKAIALDVRGHGELLFLRARTRSGLDRLSRREIDVARCFAAGRSYKQIAKFLGLSPATVRHHLARIYAKLDVHDKAELANALQRHN